MAEGGVANPHGVNPPGCWKPNTANDGTRESSIHLQQLSDADELHSDEFQIQAAWKQGGLELSGPKTREVKENPTAGMEISSRRAVSVALGLSSENFGIQGTYGMQGIRSYRELIYGATMGNMSKNVEETHSHLQFGCNHHEDLTCEVNAGNFGTTNSQQWCRGK